MTKPNEASQRGGKRPGAGRKSKHEEPMIQGSIRLPASVWAALDATGDRSEAARTALMRWAKRRKAP